MAWNTIERVEFNLTEAREALPEPVAATDDARDVQSAGEMASPVPTVVAVEYDTVLVIGSDKKPERDQIGEYADAVMLYLLPDDGSGPLIVSLPRDLVVVNPCTGQVTKLDRTLEGCGEDIGGEELVALTVEDFTGVAVDNFASFRFEAFVEMIDAVGGVEVCVPNALREGGSEILPAGCSTLDGATALRWVRSRQTQEFVDGQWRFLENGIGDASRVRRQQTLIFALLDKLKGIRSPSELAGLAENLGDTIVLDETLGLSDAVTMVWNLRAYSGSSIRTLTVPTEPTTLEDGSYAVRATMSFAELIASDS